MEKMVIVAVAVAVVLASEECLPCELCKKEWASLRRQSDDVFVVFKDSSIQTKNHEDASSGIVPDGFVSEDIQVNKVCLPL